MKKLKRLNYHFGIEDYDFLIFFISSLSLFVQIKIHESIRTRVDISYGDVIIYVLYKTFRNFVGSVMRLDRRIYIGKL